MKEKYEKMINQKESELFNFKTINRDLMENKREENIIKKELVNVHNILKE